MPRKTERLCLTLDVATPILRGFGGIYRLRRARIVQASLLRRSGWSWPGLALLYGVSRQTVASWMRLCPGDSVAVRGAHGDRKSHFPTEHTVLQEVAALRQLGFHTEADTHEAWWAEYARIQAETRAANAARTRLTDDERELSRRAQQRRKQERRNQRRAEDPAFRERERVLARGQRERRAARMQEDPIYRERFLELRRAQKRRARERASREASD